MVRKAPEASAAKAELGDTATGSDGFEYVVTLRSNKTQYWKKLSQAKKPTHKEEQKRPLPVKRAALEKKCVTDEQWFDLAEQKKLFLTWKEFKTWKKRKRVQLLLAVEQETKEPIWYTHYHVPRDNNDYHGEIQGEGPIDWFYEFNGQVVTGSGADRMMLWKNVAKLPKICPSDE